MPKKYSVSIQGHRTSYSLEDEFYQELLAIADKTNIPLARLIREIDSTRESDTNLSSALRLFVLRDLKRQIKI